MIFRAKRNTILLRAGRNVPLNGPLLLGSRRPSGGWTARFRVKGVDHTLTGKSAGDVARKTMELHKKNGISLRWEDVWLNLNLQWIERTDHKYFSVSHKELAETILEDGAQPEKTLRKEYTPSQWGSIAWKWMGLFLAQDHYSPTEFLQVLEQVLQMLNPNTNPTIGCRICHSEFAQEMGKVRINPPETREKARRWLWGFHDQVSKRIDKPRISFEKAAQLNFWN